MDSTHRETSSLRAVNLGLGTNVVLAALKTVIGITGHSPALLADGINSTSDVAYYVVVRVFMGLASKPADDEHPYGHRQLESISALIVGAFVLTTAIAIFWDAVNKVFDIWTGGGSGNTASLTALIVALGTVALKIGLTLYTRAVGKKADNPAVIALAYDHRNDIFAASAASIGIILGRMGYAWVDPLAGAIVALIILRTGIYILRESSDDLMDTLPGKIIREKVRLALDDVEGIHEVEEVLAHRFGPYIVINITIGVDGSLSVADGDCIASQVEKHLLEEVEFTRRVHVHYHPSRISARKKDCFKKQEAEREHDEDRRIS